MPVLHLMVGLPGAGKTTLARRIEREQGALRLTPDEWMVPLFGDSEAAGVRDVLEGRLIAVAGRALTLGIDVVVDFGLWGRDERTALRWYGHELGAEVRVHHLPIDAREHRERTRARHAASPDTSFFYSDEVLARQRDLFQPPTADELADGPLDPAPSGTWRWWMGERWPTSTD